MTYRAHSHLDLAFRGDARLTGPDLPGFTLAVARIATVPWTIQRRA
jgi:hypothetical protein